MASGQEKNRQRMKQLLGKPGNGNCADCGAAGRMTDAGQLKTHFNDLLKSVYPLCGCRTLLFPL